MQLPTEPLRGYKELWERSILIHGIPKIGKTTLASQFPKPIFLQTELGEGELNIYAQSCISELIIKGGREEFVGMSGWEKTKTALHLLATTKHDFQTIVFDTGDNLWLEAVKYHTITHGVEYELDGVLGYGKGPNLVERDFLQTLRWAQSLPMGLVIISHSQEKEYEVPGTKPVQKRTRIVCTLPQRAMRVINGMVDMILYCNFESGSGNRIIRTKAGPNWDAGSRFAGLSDMIPMNYKDLAEAYTQATNGQVANVIEHLVGRIHRGESALAESKIDSFEVEKRKTNARQKHAGNVDLTDCTIEQLESYLQYLMVKYREGKAVAPTA